MSRPTDQWIPKIGAFAVLTIDVSETLKTLEDPVAIAAGRRLVSKNYVVYVSGVRLPFHFCYRKQTHARLTRQMYQLLNPTIPFREEQVHFVMEGLPLDLPEQHVDSSMSFAIAPATHHPSNRPPLVPSIGQFPWPNCYLSSFLSATVRCATHHAVTRIDCAFDSAEQARFGDLEAEDCAERIDRMNAADDAGEIAVHPAPPATTGSSDDSSTIDSASVLSEEPRMTGEDVVDLFRDLLAQPEYPQEFVTVRFSHDLSKVKQLENPCGFFAECEKLIKYVHLSWAP
ncbi:hypothetical protein C8F01DRAFT_999368 [Mycena amicta]|nr:hypothetical protein C8F01DRAFT_999368 [Mycena amicta]